ncbi:hypothetical protein GLYMA_10G090350v4 [Glycine max]|nr:hypothetical protein GLYMA_10G090350v4 [Glycine max]KAH1137436.1 hypothetical protein GYH30_027437 [Glycine max]
MRLLLPLIRGREGMQEHQIQMQKWCRSHPRPLLESDCYVCEICNQDSRETRTFRCTGGGTRCHGSC